MTDADQVYVAARAGCDDDDLYVEPGCRCPVVAMAPCGWCEDGGYYDDDGRPVTPD